MDSTRFDRTLAEQLGDSDGLVYGPTLRQTALAAAVRAYSRYRGFKRRYGTGHLYMGAPVGTDTIFAVGGPFAAGSTITLDYGASYSETVVILSVSMATPEDLLVSAATKIKLTAVLTKQHNEGGFISQTTLGLTIAAGVDMYLLPPDFIEPDRDSWDMATGARRWVKRTESFYDGVYRQSELIGGVGYGQSTTFRPGTGLGGGFVGVPANSAGTVSTAGSVGNETLFEFIDGYPPMLQISPVPQIAYSFDFRYIAQALPANIPDEAFDALIAQAHAVCLESRIAVLGQSGDAKEDDVSESPSATIKALRDAADAQRKVFYGYVAGIPLATSG